MAQIIKWCMHCKNVVSVDNDPEIIESKNDYTICRTCEKKGFGKKSEKKEIVNKD